MNDIIDVLSLKYLDENTKKATYFMIKLLFFYCEDEIRQKVSEN